MVASPTDPGGGENRIATGQFCDSSHTTARGLLYLANGFQCGNGQRSLPCVLIRTEGECRTPSIVLGYNPRVNTAIRLLPTHDVVQRLQAVRKT